MSTIADIPEAILGMSEDKKYEEGFLAGQLWALATPPEEVRAFTESSEPDRAAELVRQLAYALKIELHLSEDPIFARGFSAGVEQPEG